MCRKLLLHFLVCFCNIHLYEKHSQKEKRWFVLGCTELDRKLFIIFTVRKKLIRNISARDMTKKERKLYNEEIKKHTEF